MQPIELGEVGDRVARNIGVLLATRGATYKWLSERLGEIGRPINPEGVRRIVAGRRRVDVDDLVALGEALNVPWQDILLRTLRLQWSEPA
jgi:hypothetical protein